MAAELKTYFANKLPNAKAFNLTDHTSDMLKFDLKAAGIDFEDENGRVFDFHALRHTFITNLRHAPSRVAQALARHQSSAMTDRYTHVRLHDERAALDGLPDLTRPDKSQQRATGTDGKNLAENLPSLGGQLWTTMDSNRIAPLNNNSKTHFQRGWVDDYRTAVFVHPVTLDLLVVA